MKRTRRDASTEAVTFMRLMISDWSTEDNPNAFVVMYSFPQIKSEAGSYDVGSELEIKRLLARTLGSRKAAEAWKLFCKEGNVELNLAFNSEQTDVMRAEEIPIAIGTLSTALENLMRSHEALGKYVVRLEEQLREIKAAAEKR